jgi:hypothetical protein
MIETEGALAPCGSGEYSAEPLRRVYSTVVQIATLGT